MQVSLIFYSILAIYLLLPKFSSTALVCTEFHIPSDTIKKIYLCLLGAHCRIFYSGCVSGFLHGQQTSIRSFLIYQEHNRSLRYTNRHTSPARLFPFNNVHIYVLWRKFSIRLEILKFSILQLTNFTYWNDTPWKFLFLENKYSQPNHLLPYIWDYVRQM